MRLALAVAIVFVPKLAFAACVETPAPGVPRSLRTGIAYSLAADAGHDEMPNDGQGLQPGQSPLNTICFTSFDPAGVVTDATMLTRYTSDEAIRQAAATAEATRQQAFSDEIAGTGGNDLCNAELSVIITKIDNVVTTLQGQLDATSTNAQFKAHIRNDLYPTLGTALKKIAKCVRARAR